MGEDSGNLHSGLRQLEERARQSTWFALSDDEKADTLRDSACALWVLLGRGKTIDEVLADPDCGLIAGTTRSLDSLFGYGEGMLVGEHLKILIPERFHAHHDQFFASFCLNPEDRQMGGRRVELPGRHKTGPGRFDEIFLEIGLTHKFLRMRHIALALVARRR